MFLKTNTNLRGFLGLKSTINDDLKTNPKSHKLLDHHLTEPLNIEKFNFPN